MGANMQRQAVPLLRPEAPLVGTGMEWVAGQDSGVCILAKRGGTVERVTGRQIIVRADNGELDTYDLIKFMRSNQSTCINQRPVVFKGDRVEVGSTLADGMATDGGELALGHNVLVAFVSWEGYNHEDAVLISNVSARTISTPPSILKNTNAMQETPSWAQKKLPASCLLFLKTLSNTSTKTASS